MFSVRIVDADFYVTKPIAGLDVLYSEFRESDVTRVPVLRIFGSTPSGQKTCLHVHQVFPYIFVPYDGTQPSSKYLKQLTTSVDFAVQVALGKATSSTHHVYNATIVKRTPFYGYHEEEQDFIKIQFYNPRIVTRVVDLLQNGAILNRVFQPHESHIPFILQFLIDHNLYGMNLLHARKVKFRGWTKSALETNNVKRPLSPHIESCSPFSSNVSGSFSLTPTACQHWNENTIPSDVRLGTDVPKISRCELEVDITSEDILNQLEIGTSIGSNPGIVAMWEDEKQRRRDHEQPSQITMPVSQDRGDLPLLETEKNFKTRIAQIISERNRMIQSRLDKMDKSHLDSLSPEDFHELSQSILLETKEPESPVVLSNEVNENTPVVNETIIEDVLQASQSQSQRLSGRLETDLIDILVSLADDPNHTAPPECSPTSGITQTIEAEDREAEDESENEDELSILMSQPVWNDEDLNENSEIRTSGDIIEDMDEMASNVRSIPQLDGVADEEADMSTSENSDLSDGQEKQRPVSMREHHSRYFMGKNKRQMFCEHSTGCIPQIDGCHDNEDNSETKTKDISTTGNVHLKRKAGENDIEGQDDFKTEKKRNDGRSKKMKNTLKQKTKLTTRQRKSVAPLPVFGGRSRERGASKREGGPSTGEAMTKKDDQKNYLTKFEQNRSNMDEINCEIEWNVIATTTLTRRRTTDGEEPSTAREKTQPLLEEDSNTNLGMSDGSQTSEFELRLSDSSSDNCDFKSPKKISRVSDLRRSQRLRNENVCFFEKHADFKKDYEPKNVLERESLCGGIKEKPQEEEVSRNWKNSTKKRGFLEFTEDAATKMSSCAKDNNSYSSRTSSSSQKRSRGYKRSDERKLERGRRKKTDPVVVNVDVGLPEEITANKRTGGRKLICSTKLLDACVRLEKLSIPREKTERKAVECKVSGKCQELVDEHCRWNSDLLVSDEGSDLSTNALFQMAMLSPKSNDSEGDSPPIPSSPSLNTTFSDGLINESFDTPVKCSDVAIEDQDVVPTTHIKDSSGSVEKDHSEEYNDHDSEQEHSSKLLIVSNVLPESSVIGSTHQHQVLTSVTPQTGHKDDDVEENSVTFGLGKPSEQPQISQDSMPLVPDPSMISCVWRPVKDPPSPSYILKTRDLYGLPHERHQEAFCSNPKDVPSVSRTVGGRRLQVSSLSVENLPEFDEGGHFLTLREIRSLIGDHIDNSFVEGCLRTLANNGDDANDDGYMGNTTEIKLALMGERDVIITPSKPPPSQSAVRRWMEEEKTKGTVSMPKASEPMKISKENSNLPKNDVDLLIETVNTPKTPKQYISKNKDVPGMLDENLNNSPEIHRRSQTPVHDGEIGQPGTDAKSSRGDTSQNNSSHLLAGPQHSTPLGSQRKPRNLFQCTPVDQREICENTEKQVSQQNTALNFENDDQFQRITNLRRNLLASQVNNDVKELRQLSTDASCIEGATPNNSCGFKISQPNIQNAKSIHEKQYLTLLSVEIHIRTRKTLRPDPEYDPICAIFYNIEHETKEGKKNITGVIIASNESTKLTRGTDSKPSTSSDALSVDDHVDKVTRVPKKVSTDDNFLWRTGFANDFEVITVKEECDAISRFIELVHQWDPDILVGFEVQMLSWGYMLQRCTTLGIDLASQLSRLQDSSGVTRFDAEKDKWGASYTSEISIAGRIVLNVWRLMKHEVSLNIYSFENIAYHVLHERIPLYTFQQLSTWWDQKLPHNRWRTAEHYITRCQGNIRILNHSDLVSRTSEFARLFGILFYSVISRGSQFRVESMMLRLAKPMNYLAVSPSIQQRARMCAPECIPLVMEPESRFYTDPVIVLDFQSLYPSMVIAYNYCFSTCLGKVSRLSELGSFEFGCTSLNVPPAVLEKLEDDIHVSANGAAFVKSNIRRGILPRMLEEILNTRVMVKRAMKDYKEDKALGRLLDARQLGLKLIANVTYGYTSANFSGRMPCVEIADAIVRKARETLERAIHLVNTREEWGARVVYGDTDSLFVLLKGATKEDAFKIGKEIVDAVTAANPKPVKLKFEKVYLPCVLQTKKRYVGYMYETLDQKDPVFDAKGIETVRRDTCPAVAKILEKSLRILFEAKDVSLVKRFMQRQFRKLMEDRVSVQDFIFAKEYRGMRNYKPSACVPALELTRRRLSRDRRMEPRVGERVPYVVVCGSPGLPLIQLVRSPEEVLEDPCLRLNATYYITKQMLPPLNRIFSLIGVDVTTWYSELPRFVPRRQVTTGKQKSTISGYFTTLHCPVCEELTNKGLCNGCCQNPQKAVVTLANRIRNWERKHDHLAQICFQCCGTRDQQLSCVSLDCPVMFKLVRSTRNLSYAETLRDVQRKIEITNN